MPNPTKDMFIATAFSGVEVPHSLLDPVTALPTHILALAQQATNPDALRNAWGASLVLMLLVIVVGTALDFTPTVLILTPVLMPLVKQAGIDPVYFGVLFIMNNAIGLLTPPVGTVLNVVCGVGRIPMHDVIRGVMPFLISQVVVMGSLIAFPSLVMVPLKWLLMR